MVLKFQQPIISIKYFFEVLFVIGFLTSSSIQAQNQQMVDSLRKLVQLTNTQDTTKIKAYNDLGIQYAPSNPKLAKIYINKALNIAIEIDRPRGISGSYNCLGIVYYHQKEHDSALINFKKALVINQELGHQWGQASALNQIGVVQNIKNNYYGAIQSFQQAGEIFKASNDSISFAKSMQNIGYSYARMLHYKKAIEYYLEAIQLYELLNNTEGIGRGYMNIGDLLNKQKEYKKALEYFYKVLPIVKEGGNKQSLSLILKNMGISYKGLKNYDTAMSYFRESLEYRMLTNNKKNIAIIHSQIGDIYYEMKDYNNAIKYQKEALQNYSVKGHNSSKMFSNIIISNSYLQLNKLNLAKKYAENAIEISKRIADIRGEKEVYHILSLIAKKEGNSDKALQFYMKFQQFNDSLYILENKKQVQELRIIYETDKKNLQIETQKKDIIILDAKNETKKQLLFFGGVGLISIFGFILLFKSRNTAKRRQKSQEIFSRNLITAQENERTRLARELHDSVGQKLMLLTKKIKMGENSDLVTLSENTLDELRAISRGLHPPTIEGLGVTRAIIAMINEVDKYTNIFFTNEIENIDNVLSKEFELHLYRIVQEVLNNIVKHANAKETFITIEKERNFIKMSIEDNGSGFDFSKELNNNVSLGMKTLRERVKIIKSNIKITTQLNKGTIVKLVIPI